MLVDIIRRPLDNKALWLILLILFNGIAALAYHGLVYRKDVKLGEGEQPESSNAVLLIVLVIFFAGVIVAVIFTFASGLMFSVSGPTAGVACKSDDSSRIPVNSFDIAAETSFASAELLGRITISNRSGGKISGIKCTGSNAFAEVVSGCPSSLGHGSEAVLKPGASIEGIHQTGDIILEFSDFSGMNRTVKIACTGPITVS